MGKKPPRKAYSVPKSNTDAHGRPLKSDVPLNTISRASAQSDDGTTMTKQVQKDTVVTSRIKFRAVTQSKPGRVQSSSDEPKFTIVEKNGDLLLAPEEYSLAHCVAEDLHMNSGIAIEFRKKFKGTGILLDQQKKTGEVAVLNINGRYIYYLVTKRLSKGKPTIESLTRSLEGMREHAVNNVVCKIAMPTIGCGLDRLDWKQVKATITSTFQKTDIQIVIYNYNKVSEEEESLLKAPIKLTQDSLLNIDENNTIYAYLASTNNEFVTQEMKALNGKYSFLSDFKKRDKKLCDFVEQKNTVGLICVDDEGYLSYEALEKSAKKYNQKLKKEQITPYMGLEVDYEDELLLKKLEHTFKFSVQKCEVWICHPKMTLEK